MPLLGNPTAAVFYPGKLVFAVLPYAWAARVYIVIHTALAFLGDADLDAVVGHKLVWIGVELLWATPLALRFCFNTATSFI